MLQNFPALHKKIIKNLSILIINKMEIHLKLFQRTSMSKGEGIMRHNKTFRLFISSTFSDFREERQVLQEKVFPEINRYLQQNHPDYTFQPIDLRWGVSEEAQYDQKTLELCLNEVRSCKHYLHPNFLIMSGNRYGWIPLPYAIENNEFHRLYDYLSKSTEEELQKVTNILIIGTRKIKII